MIKFQNALNVPAIQLVHQPNVARKIKNEKNVSDLIRGAQASPIVQLIRQLAEPKPGDLVPIDLSDYKGIQPPFDSWDYIVKICEEISVELGDRL